MRDNEHDKLCATKAGRAKCLAAVQVIAAKQGATVELHEFNGAREIGLELIYGPYACMIHFDGGSKVGAFMGHWHMNRTERDDARTYPETFWRVGSLNQYHKQKATTICGTLAEFCDKLEYGLALLRAAKD